VLHLASCSLLHLGRAKLSLYIIEHNCAYVKSHRLLIICSPHLPQAQNWETHWITKHQLFLCSGPRKNSHQLQSGKCFKIFWLKLMLCWFPVLWHVS
jgi:hypothetical protein